MMCSRNTNSARLQLRCPWSSGGVALRAVWWLSCYLLAGLWAWAAEPSLGLRVRADGELRLAGIPFRGIGVNDYDLFVRTLAQPARTNDVAGLDALAERRIPFLRFSAGGYWPSEWGLYQTNRAEHFARLDAVVRHAEQRRLGLIPSLFWMLSTVPDLVGEPVQAWGQTNSRTHAFLRQYTREVVTRYRTSPSIWAWEFGNEFNLAADLPNAAEHRPPVVPSMGTPAARSQQDELTHAMVRVALRAFAEEVRRHDPDRLILSGHAFPRASAWHQIAERSWTRDTPAQFAEVLAADHPDPVNSLTVRGYDQKEDCGRLEQAMTVARSVRKPLFVGEFGVPGRATEAAQAQFRSMLSQFEKLEVPLAALWVFDFPAQADDWNVTATNERRWQLDEIQQANTRWAQRLPKDH